MQRRSGLLDHGGGLLHRFLRPQPGQPGEILGGKDTRAARAREHVRHARELRDLAVQELEEWENRDTSR